MFYIDTLHEVLHYGFKAGGLGIVSDNVMSSKFRKSNAKYIYVKSINGINVATLKSLAANIVAHVFFLKGRVTR